MKQKKNPEDYLKPVPKSVESNSLHSIQTNKVVLLGLSEKADELRSAGCSLSEICRTLNDKYLSESEYKLSVMSLSRYFDKWSKLDKQDNRISPEENLNIYNEYKTLYDITIDSLEAIQQSIEELKKQKDYKGIRENSFLAEKLTARCQNLLQSMSDSLSKVYTYSNLNRIVQITLDIVKAENVETYAAVVNQIKQNVELAELMKQIKETKEK